MITPAYAQAMCTYNAEMNRRLYAAAGRLSDAERRQDRGAFFRSIWGTFNHLLWADRMWMSRFDGWERPAQAIGDSGEVESDWAALELARVEADARIAEWAAGLSAAWLEGEVNWYSGAVQADMVRPRAMLVVHMFNHQTHHRGQAHAMLTAAGEATGPTDFWVVAAQTNVALAGIALAIQSGRQSW